MGDTLARCDFSSAENIDVILSTIAHHPNLIKTAGDIKSRRVIKAEERPHENNFLRVTVKIVVILSFPWSICGYLSSGVGGESLLTYSLLMGSSAKLS